jgi:hypothetical protein
MPTVLDRMAISSLEAIKLVEDMFWDEATVLWSYPTDV